MAYNFELTFTRPLLAKLDAGALKGSKDWANAITDAYITTIKSGFPMAVPPILPAPGLNPTAPPPFTIGVSPYTTADLRRRSMYRIIHAYFSIRELKLDKASILSLKNNITLLLKKIKERIKQVKLVIEEIKLIQDQLKILPKLTKEIIQNIKQEIKHQVDDISDAFKILDGVRPTISPSDFESLYTNELNLLQKIKSFNPTNLPNIAELSLLLSDYGSRSDNVLSNFNSTMSIKQYLYGKIVGVGKILLQLSEGVVDPSKIVNVVNDLATKKQRVQNLAKRLQQFTYYLSYLQPKLKRLQAKKNRLILDIRKKIQSKITTLKNKLQSKIQEFVKKKQESKRDNLYSKAAKNKIDKKKKTQQRIKKILSNIKKISSIYKTIIQIIGKTTSLVLNAKNAFEAIKKDITDYQKKIKETQNSIQELGSAANDINMSPPTVDLESLDQAKLKQELSKLQTYMTSGGLGQFGNLGAMVLIQTKCDFQTFVRFFERNTASVQMFIYEIIALLEDIEKLSKQVKSFNSNTNQTQNQITLPRVRSLKDALLHVSTKVIPTVQLYPKWAKTQTKKEKSKLQLLKEKFKKDLKSFALNMVPIKSDVQDKKDKSQELAAKEKRVRDKIQQIKKIVTLLNYTSKMVRSGSTIYKNIQKGDYTMSTNQEPIESFLNAYYLYKSFNQPASNQQHIQVEKRRAFDRLKGIAIVDFLIRALMQTIKDPNRQKIIDQLDSDLADLKSNPPAFQTVNVIRNLFSVPPTSKKQLIDSINTVTLSALQDVSVINKVIQIEKKYLGKLKELIKTTLDIKQVEGTSYETIMLSVLQKLDKGDSFIVILIKYIKDLVTDFTSFVKTKIQNVAKRIKEKLQKSKQDKESQFKKNIAISKKKGENSDAIFMSFMFATAARLFWTGAGWLGPTGSQHRIIGIGNFRPRLKGKPNEGSSTLIRQLAKAYELQLLGMRGLVIPPPPTGIPPLPFNGYK